VSLTTVGDGPIRALYTLKGLFNDDLFVVSNKTLYRVDSSLNVTQIIGEISGSGFPQMVGRADSSADRLFIADGTNLFYYEGGEVAATGTLTLAANPTAGDTVTIGSKTYTFVSALDSVNGPANAVVIGAAAANTITNFVAAINGTSGEGFFYGSGTVASTQVTAVDGSGDTVVVSAIVAGDDGNNIATTETLTAGGSGWGGSTLGGGTNAAITAIATPDSVGIVSIDVLAQHVLCVVANSQRFYWIAPGDVDISTLNFAEAEQQPDELVAVRVVGDIAWMLGEGSSEVWYANPSATSEPERFLRQEGQAFSRGIVEGTDAVIDNTLFVVGDDDQVYVGQGDLRPISTPFIAEKVRELLEA
jgi:hypothetical protein